MQFKKHFKTASFKDRISECLILDTAAIRLKILIAINREIKIVNRD